MNHYTSSSIGTDYQKQQSYGTALGTPLAGLGGVSENKTPHTPTASEELKCLEEALNGLDANLKDLESRLCPICLNYPQSDGSLDRPEPQVSSFTSDVQRLKQRVIATAHRVYDLTNHINL